MLQLLREQQQYSKPSKRLFRVRRYITWVILHLIKVSRYTLTKLNPWWTGTIPKNLKNLRGFLVLIGYYHKFVWNYWRIATPLTTLLKNESFSWTLEATQAFKQLKEAMWKAPILTTPDFTKTFIVECDASGNGIDVVLMQEG